jgi:hypothetical protein
LPSSMWFEPASCRVIVATITCQERTNRIKDGLHLIISKTYFSFHRIFSLLLSSSSSHATTRFLSPLL